MGIRLIKISAAYFAIGVLIGYYMSTAHNYELTPVHVHINLLGWTSLTLAGILYQLFPTLGENKLAKAHFWLHNIGLPVMMIGLALMILLRNEQFVPIVAIGGTFTALAVLTFSFNVIKNLKPSS
ncbi:cbb3-type cytochrome c oxidase subunit I [Bacillus sp. CGMCC 1.16541]|uniref:cbb3-type cytochrome c oxidase subunit I n=1 Tax=Bacillus sp. CGMCC 1.16541 TaxID=2185143 RepID=UPI000D73C28E|nr:cbb3-type cytochrome c oxidase subunit I [Bacillus sp. CGMCC 1.16541]